MSEVLLEARDLTKTYGGGGLLSRRRRARPALDHVSVSVMRGETLGLVGESGCGKSTLGRTLLRLHEPDSGEVIFEGRDIIALSAGDMRRLRPEMQMVFQDSYAALNPKRRIGALLAEPMRVHRRRAGAAWTPTEIAERIDGLLDLVGLNRTHLQRYAHEMSGGQRQRVNIARALMLSPKLIVADEPVSALDVSIQAQVVNLLVDLQQRLGLTYVFVSHDLGVVRQIADRVAVMYGGVIVELGDTDTVLHRPAHPYTAALLDAVLDPHLPFRRRASAPPVVTGADSDIGCRYAGRCANVAPLCRQRRPELGGQDGRMVACHFPLA